MEAQRNAEGVSTVDIQLLRIAREPTTYCGAIGYGRQAMSQLHPLVAPQVSHLQHEPLRTSVSWPHSEHGSPS